MAGSGLGLYFNHFKEIWENMKYLNLRLRENIVETKEHLLDPQFDADKRQELTILKDLFEKINEKTNIFEIELLLFNEFFKRIDYWLNKQND